MEGARWRVAGGVKVKLFLQSDWGFDRLFLTPSVESKKALKTKKEVRRWCDTDTAEYFTAWHFQSIGKARGA